MNNFKSFESKQINLEEVRIIPYNSHEECEELYLKLKDDPQVTPRFIEYHKEYLFDVDKKKKYPSWRCFMICLGPTKVGTIGYFQMPNILKTEKSSYSPPLVESIDRERKYLKPHEYWMGWFVVLPEYRGSGISKIAVSLLIKEIKTHDPKATKLLLNTSATNYGAHKFYEKSGFSILSTVGEYCNKLDINKHDHFTCPDDDLIFYKEI